jgi:alkylation response protein AidB-like acyl-CoA dehydrogenase
MTINVHRGTSGRLRLLAFAVTEPEVGSDTARISTYAKKEGSRYVVNGRKIFISRFRGSDLMFLVARTSTYNPERRYDGISLFLVDLRDA